GASLTLGYTLRNPLIYLKDRASLSSSNVQNGAVLVMTPNRHVVIDDWHEYDTLYCTNLAFDYSQVNAGLSSEEISSTIMRQRLNLLCQERRHDRMPSGLNAWPRNAVAARHGRVEYRSLHTPRWSIFRAGRSGRGADGEKNCRDAL